MHNTELPAVVLTLLHMRSSPCIQLIFGSLDPYRTGDFGLRSCQWLRRDPLLIGYHGLRVFFPILLSAPPHMQQARELPILHPPPSPAASSYFSHRHSLHPIRCLFECALSEKDVYRQRRAAHGLGDRLPHHPASKQDAVLRGVEQRESPQRPWAAQLLTTCADPGMVSVEGSSFRTMMQTPKRY